MRKKELRQIEIKRSLFILSRLSLWLQKNKGGLLSAFILGFVLLVWLYFPLSLFRKLDFWAYDSWLKRLPPLRDPRVIILSVDEESLKDLGPWPWPRKLHARLVEKLKNAGAKTVVFDVVFTPPRPEDPLLARSFRGTRVVLAAYAEEVLGFRLSQRGIQVSELVLPAPVLRKEAFSLGHIALIFDEDGIVRRAPAFLADEKISLPALGIAGALAYRGKRLTKVSFSPRNLQSGNFTLPLNPDGSFFIRYYGPRGTFPSLRVSDFLAGKIPPEVFNEKLVIIGVTAVGISDEWPTPYIDQGSLAGVEIHASIIQSLLQGDLLSPLSQRGRLLLALAFFFLAWVSLRRPLWALLGVVIFPGLIWGLGFLAFRYLGLFIGFSPYVGALVLGFLGGSGAAYYRQRERARRKEIYDHRWQALLKRFSLKEAASYFLAKYETRKVRLYLLDEEKILEIHEWPQRETVLKAGEAAPLARRLLKELKDQGGLLLETPVDEETKLYLLLEGAGERKPAEISQELNTIVLLLRQRRLLSQIKKTEEEFVESYLRLLRERAPELHEHSLRVAEIVRFLAERLDLPEEEKRALHYAALLHDLGLLELPSQEPWLELHPLLAADILGGVSFLRKSVVYIRHHHERYDGKGYPDGLRGEEIPLGARLLALAEGFVELWEKLEKEAEDWGELQEQILKVLRREAGRRFDPYLIEVLEKEGGCQKD